MELSFAAGLIAWLSFEEVDKPGWEPGYLRIVRWYLQGQAPDSELRIVFCVGDRACLYGVVDRLWDEGFLDVSPQEVGALVFLAAMRWEEALLTGELPRRCMPDSEGVTWLALWEDW